MIEKIENLPDKVTKGKDWLATGHSLQFLINNQNELIKAHNKLETAVRYLAMQTGDIHEKNFIQRVNEILNGKGEGE